jgi:hypothetical protein
MFNIETINEELKNLIGIKDEGEITLNTDLNTSTSGLYLNNHHPLLRLENIENSRPEQQDLVEYLTDIRDSSISKMLNDVYVKKQLNKAVKETLTEDTPLFDSTAPLRNIETPRGRFVGLMLRPSKTNNLQSIVSQVSLQLVSAQTLPIYLFHSSQRDPLDSVDLIYTKPASTQWFVLPEAWILQYKTNETDAGGAYMIGYYEDDLESNNKAIYREHNFAKAPCGSCNRWNASYYRTWSPYTSISAGYFTPQELETFPSITDLHYSDRNFGLNIKIKFKCDLTAFILEHSRALVYPLLDRMAIDIIRHFEMMPTRNNAVMDKVAKESYIAINGVVSENNYIKSRGLIHDYEDKLKALSFEYSRLDPVCVPCNDRSIKWNK